MRIRTEGRGLPSILTGYYTLSNGKLNRENSLTRPGEECRGPSTPEELHFVKSLLRAG